MSRVLGPIQEEIQIHLVGDARKPDVVAVAGRVAKAVEAAPAVLSLPRTSANGPVFTATCLCRSTDGRQLALSAEACPLDFCAGFDGRCRCKCPSRQDYVGPARGQIIGGWATTNDPISVHVGNRDALLEIPVTCR